MNRTKLIFFTIAALLFAGRGAAQQQQLTVPAAKISVMEVFSLIREQTGLGVAYNADQLDASRKVVLPAAKLTVDEALAAIGKEAGMQHSYNGRMILLTLVPAKAGEAQSTLPAQVIRQLGDSSPLDEEKPLAEEGVRELPEKIVVDFADNQVAEEAPVPVSNYRELSGYTSSLRSLPHMGIKTNLLYGFGTLTPNLALELGLGKHTSLELGGSYNPWKLKGSLESNRKLVHMLLRSEFRYWFCERFNGHFLGAHALFGRYNIGSYNVPSLFEKKYRYDGIAYGGGISYGYDLMLGKRWNLEFVAGVGVMQLEYDRYDCAACDRNPKRESKTYFGPTNAAINIVFLIK